ncbi:MAG: hypothetical protein VYD19_00155 [Myxococcota bacterium]|nr:hypothetical protein [Myxococcota bacterium]
MKNLRCRGRAPVIGLKATALSPLLLALLLFSALWAGPLSAQTSSLGFGVADGWEGVISDPQGDRLNQRATYQFGPIRAERPDDGLKLKLPPTQPGERQRLCLQRGEFAPRCAPLHLERCVWRAQLHGTILFKLKVSQQRWSVVTMIDALVAPRVERCVRSLISLALKILSNAGSANPVVNTLQGEASFYLPIYFHRPQSSSRSRVSAPPRGADTGQSRAITTPTTDQDGAH